MRICIVIADQADARFYETLGFTRPLKLTVALTNPAAHLRDQDLTSDRPGRIFGSSGAPGRRRGATTRHATGGENAPRRHATHLFARRVAAALERARCASRFERLVLVAAPAFLGELRTALPAALRPYITTTVAKDIANHHHAETEVRRYLTRDMFTAPSGFSPTLRIPDLGQRIGYRPRAQ